MTSAVPNTAGVHAGPAVEPILAGDGAGAREAVHSRIDGVIVVLRELDATEPRAPTDA